MQTLLHVLSGITDLLIIVFIFAWMYEFARKDQTKRNHHFGWWTLVAIAVTAGLMYLAGSLK
ncbi:hypothetical protein [Lentilactobacillus kisonensis]|uniref:Uncharacterized protein n=2 Tax=Lentilactobacillus kisonensis TaxID=481722 RepID=H1LDU0_9LACO|nr:hypothetical protein [Lentilactobacillus kisonensis]EHO53061.1 hypothetical protein HMPREF9104_00765 [Lentilactobacillus kisonensis F0435]KRL22739.1 hypothetical protein FC98_GL001973 [Lentilactobacillus kisonensis DSM 19906 = JCM 15041]